MSDGNGNGETQKIIDLRHAYKEDVAQTEADLKAKFDEELANAKKDLKDKYLEKVVDWFYSNGFNGNGHTPTPVEAPPEPTPEPDELPKEALPEERLPAEEPALTTPVCADCGAELPDTAKFCTQCAAPVETETDTGPAAVAPAGRVTRPAARPQPQPVKTQYRALEDRRFNEWARTRRR